MQVSTVRGSAAHGGPCSVRGSRLHDRCPRRAGGRWRPFAPVILSRYAGEPIWDAMGATMEVGRGLRGVCSCPVPGGSLGASFVEC